MIISILSLAVGFLTGHYSRQIASAGKTAFRALGYRPRMVEDYTPPAPVPEPTPGIVLEKAVDSPTTDRAGGELHPGWAAPAPVVPPPPPEKTIAQKIADPDLPLVDRLNLRYDFADVKISDALKIMTWKNYAGKRMQAPFDRYKSNQWRRACTLIEDSIYDVKTVKKTGSGGPR